jgi:hypothetical protein
MGEVTKLGTKSNVHNFESSVVDPKLIAFQNHILDAIDEFVEEHGMPLGYVIQALEMAKLTMFIDNTIEYE